MNLKLILTFDHELPLGGVRSSYKEALFDPTKRLFNLADDLNVPVVLFTDVLCALRFRDWDFENFYKPYTEQLQEAVRLDDDVQLHLHPHWLSSRFENNTFIPSKEYKLADFSLNPVYTIEKIIKMGVEILQEICRSVQEWNSLRQFDYQRILLPVRIIGSKLSKYACHAQLVYWK